MNKGFSTPEEVVTQSAQSTRASVIRDAMKRNGPENRVAKGTRVFQPGLGGLAYPGHEKRYQRLIPEHYHCHPSRCRVG